MRLTKQEKEYIETRRKRALLQEKINRYMVTKRITSDRSKRKEPLTDFFSFPDEMNRYAEGVVNKYQMPVKMANEIICLLKNYW